MPKFKVTLTRHAHPTRADGSVDTDVAGEGTQSGVMEVDAANTTEAVQKVQDILAAGQPGPEMEADLGDEPGLDYNGPLSFAAVAADGKK